MRRISSVLVVGLLLLSAGAVFAADTPTAPSQASSVTVKKTKKTVKPLLKAKKPVIKPQTTDVVKPAQ